MKFKFHLWSLFQTKQRTVISGTF